MAQLCLGLATSHLAQIVNARNLADPKQVAVFDAGYRRLADALANAKPDVSLIISADHVNKFFIDNMPAFLPQVKAGKLRAIAVASPKRASAAPDIPTFGEAGLKGYTVSAWKGLMAPAATPPAIIQRLHAAAVKVLADPEIRSRMIAMGAEPVGDTPEQFGKTLREESATWAKLVKSTGATLE